MQGTDIDMTSATDDSLFEFPCDFPIKVMGKSHPDFTDTVVLVIQEFDNGFHSGQIETRPSSGGNYTGLTCTVRAVSRAQLDDIYRALSAHPMVSVVM
jgi:putative lipoic acid-binding regulatory protein